MYELFVEDHFDSAHYLRHYHGKCENLHGHRYKVVVRLEGTRLDEAGLAYDFAQLKRELRQVTDRFDHHCLNEVIPFDKIEPSCENIAATIFHELLPRISEAPVTLTCVEVWESPTTGVAYRP
jgi:6-pyruvoyltetrahydropterin/6-carboxytetrahydropterin synthase